MTIGVPNLQKQFLVRTFYQFRTLSPHVLRETRSLYHESGLALGLTGTVLLSKEGCNGTIAGCPEAVSKFFVLLNKRFPGIVGQDTNSETQPFNRWKVPIKEQLVTAHEPDLRPEENFSDQKTAQEWDLVRAMVRDGRAQMLDVRNAYEVAIGTFPEAIDPDTTTFRDFSHYLDREVGRSLDPAKPTAIFCTGGIRCEKARVDLEQRGFQDVWQLQGGIIGYLKKSDEPAFRGECFVFDDRVALDSKLAPTQTYEICPVCRGPRDKTGSEHDCTRGRKR